jgi:hypothetical protein
MAEGFKLGGGWKENGRVLDGMDTKVKRRTHPGDVGVYGRVALHRTLNKHGVKTYRQARYISRRIRAHSGDDNKIRVYIKWDNLFIR